MTWLRKIAMSPSGLAYLLVVVNAIGAMAVDIHLPAMPTMVVDLNTSTFMVQMVMIVFVLGSTCFRLIWGPLCDAYGRKYVLKRVLAFTFVGHLGCTLAPTIEWLIFFRFVMSLGAGAIYIISGAMIAHHFADRRRAYMLGLLEMAFPVAFVISPIIGAWLLHFVGWRGVFGFILILQSLAQLLLWRTMPDEQPSNSKGLDFKEMLTTYKSFVSDPLFVTYALLPGVAIGSYAMFVASSPFIYINNLGLSEQTYGYLQAIPLVVSFIALVIYRNTLGQWGIDKAFTFGVGCYALYGFCVAALVYHWLLPTVVVLLSLSCILTFSNAFIVSPSIYKSSEIFSKNKGAAFSLISFSRGMVVGLCILFGSSLFNGQIESIFIAVGIVALVVLSLALMAFVLPLVRIPTASQEEPLLRD